MVICMMCVSVTCRMRAHLRSLADALAPLVAAPGAEVVQEISDVCFPAALLSGCLGATLPAIPPRRSRRVGSCAEDERCAAGLLVAPYLEPGPKFLVACWMTVLVNSTGLLQASCQTP